MSGPFVLDASVTLTWAFTKEATPFTTRVLESLQTTHAVTPALWPFEVLNALADAERRGRISTVQQAEFLERLRQLPIQIEHRLTAYDAAYLELASREGMPLATLDEHLKTAATVMG